MGVPRLFEFNDEFANLPGAEFEYWSKRLTGLDKDRLVEMYEARREFSDDEQRKVTRPLIRWGDGTATPIRREGETTAEWLRVVGVRE